MKTLLARYFGGHTATLEPRDFENATATANSRRSRAMGSLISLWKYISNRRLKDLRLPWTRQDVEDTELCTYSKGKKKEPANHIHVLLCLPYMRWAKKLHQVDTCNLRSDQDFFLSLRKEYSLACQSRCQSIFTRPRRVKSLEFVKVRHLSKSLNNSLCCFRMRPWPDFGQTTCSMRCREMSTYC